MSAPIALPAPRSIRLPRVRFKKPRWPKGSRWFLSLAVLNAFFAAWGIVRIVTDTASVLTLAATALIVFAAIWTAQIWWRSRDDDDGPSAA